MSKPRAGRIDTSTGRNKRDKSPIRTTRKLAPERYSGSIVRKGKLDFQRKKTTG
jgi:hypothetical protein